jgi:hypothetical protein
MGFEAALREKKETLLLVFQRFVLLLSTLDPTSSPYFFCIGSMREMGRYVYIFSNGFLV